MRADRALSGRLVCNSCGTPLGNGRRLKNQSSIYRKLSLKNNKFFLFSCLLILAFILVVI